MKIPEIISPAGNLKKLEYAYIYGADACYVGLEFFNLRSNISNFSLNDLKKAIELKNKYNKKLYVALNIFALNEQLNKIKERLEILKNYDIDALIISDLGIFKLIKEIFKKDIPDIHLSTQANITNYLAAQVYNSLGFKRVILARELNLNQIKKIKQNTSMEIEIFIHGAMCMAISGRCFLSNYLTKKKSNLGMCTNTCRWEYKVVEKTRPEQFFDVIQENNYTYIFNSKDLCTINIMPDLLELSIDGFKIEGRNKSINYVATITGLYKYIRDAFINDKNYIIPDDIFNLIYKVTNRGYTLGFYKPGNIDTENFKNSHNFSEYKFIGTVDKLDENILQVEVKNLFNRGDYLEYLTPSMKIGKLKVLDILDKENFSIKTAKPNQRLKILVDKKIENNSILTKK